MEDDEFRFQRHGAVVAEGDRCGGQHGVEILGLVFATLAVRAVGAVNFIGAVVFRAVQGYQQVLVQTAHGFGAAGFAKDGHDIVEHGVEVGRLNRIQLGAHLAVTGDLGHAEQCLAVRTALRGLQMALVRQERRALHEERGEGGNDEIGHAVRRVLPGQRVGQGLAVAAQRGDESIRHAHGEFESRSAFAGNRENATSERLTGYRDICDSPRARPTIVRNELIGQ